MLEVKNLKVETEGKILLDGFNLKVNPGEIHAIMGPNGAGKSSFSKVVAGHPSYHVVEGSVLYEGEDLLKKDIDKRALDGIFVSFQYPIEISGISNFEFLYSAYNKRQEKEKRLSKKEFTSLLIEKLEELDIKADFIGRCINEGFSGGEKKKNEILQLLLFKPKLSILDEIDSGLDVDALKILTSSLKKYKNERRSFILITHYQRLLNYLKPDFVHIIKDGKIIKSGSADLAHEIEKHGYESKNKDKNNTLD